MRVTGFTGAFLYILLLNGCLEQKAGEISSLISEQDSEALLEDESLDDEDGEDDSDTDPADTENEAPVIHSLQVTAGSDTQVGGLVSVTSNVTDADSDPLTYLWEIVEVKLGALEASSVTLINEITPVVSFVAPDGLDNYEVRLKLTVADAESATSSEITANIQDDTTDAAERFAAFDSIIKTKCVLCHSTPKINFGAFATYSTPAEYLSDPGIYPYDVNDDGAITTGEGFPLIFAGVPELSTIYVRQKGAGVYPDIEAMPAAGDPLTEVQLEVFSIFMTKILLP